MGENKPRTGPEEAGLYIEHGEYIWKGFAKWLDRKQLVEIGY